MKKRMVLMILVGLVFTCALISKRVSERSTNGEVRTAHNQDQVEVEPVRESLSEDHLAKSERRDPRYLVKKLEAHDLALSASVSEALSLDKKVLRSRAENLAYHRSLSSEENIRDVVSILSQIKETPDDSTFIANQRERMDAALFLTRALEWAENPRMREVKSAIAGLVTDDAIQRASNPEMKKSLAADRIELFANLKGIDPVAGRDIEKSTQSESALKLMKFANNFYRLNEKKKN